MQGTLAVGCGQCMPCRINRGRLWTHRMMLESMCHDENCFLTLTYNQDNLPAGGTLVPRDVQLFLKSLRKKLYPRKLRYYFVGEYGDQSQRPHYHAALFGVGRLDEPFIKECWPHGHILLGDLTLASAQYICQYVTKKMTQKSDPRLNGRYPEFARMSLKPGIGALAVPNIGDVLFSEYGRQEILETGDVPRSLKHGRRSLPLGRYLRQKLRDEIGMPDEYKKKKTFEYTVEMSALFEDALRDPSNATKSLSQILVDANIQKIRNIETRAKIFKKGQTL